MMADSPIHLVWHGRYGERRWTEFLLSGLNIVATEAGSYSPSAQSEVIHAISTGNKGLPGNPEAFRLLQSDIRDGKKVGIIHLSDEWFRSDTSWYEGAAFVLKYYYCSFITHPAIKYLPLGCPEHIVIPGKIKSASERGLLWSFCGQRKYSRVEMLSALEGISPHQYPQAYISGEDYQNMVNDTVFAPCPMGNTTPDTWRLYEALEAGCIPIVEKRWTIDYFARIFPDSCPMPRFQTWASAARWMQKNGDAGTCDRLQAEIQHWWISEKAKLRGQVAQFVLERFANHPDGSLLQWRPPYQGFAHTARWVTELCRYTTFRSLFARVWKQLGFTKIARRK